MIRCINLPSHQHAAACLAAILCALLFLFQGMTAPCSALAADIVGTNNDDIIENPSSDTVDDILALDGNDTVTNDGNVLGNIEGGAGDDTITNNDDVVGNINGGDDNDTIINNDFVVYDIHGGEGDDNITNNGSVNTIYGEEGNDIITNEDYCDEIFGGDGDDTITNNSEVDETINGGAGNDTIINNALVDDEEINGGSGDDTITNNGEIDGGIIGEDGKDYIINNGTVTHNISGDNGNYTIINNDTVEYYISGGDGNDTITNNGEVGGGLYGGWGDDTIINNGLVDNDDLEGEDGNDVITNNGTVNNYLRGGDGDDTITNNSYIGFQLHAGDDNDLVYNYGTIVGHLHAGYDDDIIYNYDYIGQTLYGDFGDDIIYNYGEVNWRITGGFGDDTIYNYGTIQRELDGESGNDLLYNYGEVNGDIDAGDDNDTVYNYGSALSRLYLGAGNDILYNYGLVNSDIGADEGNDTIHHYGIAGAIGTGSGTDYLYMYDGSRVTGDGVSGFEYLFTLGQVTFDTGNLSLDDLIAMSVVMPSNTSPIIESGVYGNTTADLSVLVTGGAWLDGQSVTIFSSGPTSVDFATATVEDSSGVLDFSISLDGIVTASRVASFGQILGGSNDSILNLAALLEGLSGSTDPALTPILGQLNFLSPGELEDVLIQMLPMMSASEARFTNLHLGSSAVLGRLQSLLNGNGSYQALSLASLTGDDTFAANRQLEEQALEHLRFASALSSLLGQEDRTLDRHLDAFTANHPDLAARSFTSLEVGVPGAGDLGPMLDLGLTGDLGVWSRVMGSLSRQHDRDSAFGYDGWSAGLAGGLDYQFTDELIAGLFFSWIHTDLTFDDPGDSSLAGDTYQFGAYGLYALDDWFVEASLSYGFGFWQADRRVVIGASEYAAESEQATSSLSTSLYAGMDFYLDDLVVTPVLGLEYSYLHEYGYTEHGAGALDLEVDDAGRNSLRSIVGADLAYPLPLGREEEYTLTPSLKAQWIHEYLAGEEISARFVNHGSFTADSPDPDRDTARLGASLLLSSPFGLSGYLAYETDISETALDHSLALGLRLEF